MTHPSSAWTVGPDAEIAHVAASTAMPRRAKAFIGPRILTASHLGTLDSRCYGFCYVALRTLYPLATLLSASPDSAVKNEPDYTILKRRIQDAGLLEKRPAYYVLSLKTT